ncbi:DNA topoisomerase 2 [Porphyridium purpureum]|uniref:DNA topoisomerase 2 n=1 Tax=Porphyridium purpureum TaxID=35688 RepID=A0A5J4Z1P1_PORPP|nr:DNA topoisomerase 2 [Porphyridium purpureum]|eukprot:POR6240..scf295_1
MDCVVPRMEALHPAQAGNSNQNKRLGPGQNVEEMYKKVSQLEHVLLRPDTYIGSAERVAQTMWVWDEPAGKMVYREVHYVPGLYKIFDEILVNAADHKQRDASLDTIKVDIDTENNLISVFNNGSGIPVEMHKKEGVYVPEMIFGQLLTSSNYNDSEKKVVGGRNGYGAKLANIFSTKFVVETADSARGLKYRQVFRDNMQQKEPPTVKSMGAKKEDWTRLSFSPDLAKFGATHLDTDTFALFKKRVYDIAGANPGIKVWFNGERIPIRTFKDYVNLYMHEKPDVPLVHERCGERWEVVVTASDGQFNQVSFVNSIWTIKGGTHVTHVADQIVAKLSEHIAKKSKTVAPKPFQIKSHLSIFVNCLVENPAFDSQTKETLTSKPSSFGSKCVLSEELMKKVIKSGVVENILAFAKFKQEKELSKTDGGKKIKVLGVPKLDDANKAGSRESCKCTLILTEGDSAKALAISGLSVIGRDYYGVFPLRGKLLNVREATHKQIMDNAELSNLKKILGLQQNKTYDAESVKQLRYGHVLIMTDQDHDGSHIKGLLINFLEHFWPSLLEVPGFLQEFITPIVKCTRGQDQKIFFTMPEYKTWFEAEMGSGARSRWNIKYYKGLGTSTSSEAKQYFGDLDTHLLTFKHAGSNCNQMIDLAFSKQRVADRKVWLAESEPNTFLDYARDELTYSNFINKELVLFSLADNERSIPSVVDGLKPSQRKVLFACFKRKLKTEIKVAQLAGYVSEHAAYHHGEASLMSTIVGLAQNFVGANNINLLVPSGQFGTRLQGGKDAASARYIFTRLAKVTRALFPEKDDQILEYLDEDGMRIEPKWYCPIIPLALVNGADGIGTGWSTSVPCYNPRDLVKIIRSLLAVSSSTDETQLQRTIYGIDLVPWYRGFKGSVHAVENSTSFDVHGRVYRVDADTLRVVELPIRSWTSSYKEWLESNVVGAPSVGDNTQAKSAFVRDIRDLSTEDQVDFTVTVTPGSTADTEDLFKKLRLSGSVATSNMVFFDPSGRIRKYDSTYDIVLEHFSLRLSMYEKRKAAILAELEMEQAKLENKARFILMVAEGKLKVSKRSKAAILDDLVKLKFKPFPPRRAPVAEQTPDDEQDDEEGDGNGNVGAGAYDYLLGMQLWSLTLERVNALIQERDAKIAEAQAMRMLSPQDLWNADLDALMIALEQDEREYEESKKASEAAPSRGKSKKPASGTSKSSGTGKVDLERELATLEPIPAPSARMAAVRKSRAVPSKIVGAKMTGVSGTELDMDSALEMGIDGVLADDVMSIAITEKHAKKAAPKKAAGAVSEAAPSSGLSLSQRLVQQAQEKHVGVVNLVDDDGLFSMSSVGAAIPIPKAKKGPGAAKKTAAQPKRSRAAAGMTKKKANGGAVAAAGSSSGAAVHESPSTKTPEAKRTKLKKRVEVSSDESDADLDDDQLSSDEEAKVLEAIQRRGVTPVQRSKRERRPTKYALALDSESDASSVEGDEDEDDFVPE